MIAEARASASAFREARRLLLGRGKFDIIAVLRRREAEGRHLITQWLANRFNSSPSGLCAHCGDGERVGDPFVVLFVGDGRTDVDASCHAGWRAKREAEARAALGIEALGETTVRWLRSDSGEHVQ